MAEQKNSMPPRRPGGPGHGPRSHGYQRPQDLRGTVKKLLHYVGRYKGLLVLVAVCLLLSSVGSVASSYFLKPAINDYILPGDFAGLLKLLVLMGLVFVLSALCSYVYSRIMVRVSQRTVAALRQGLHHGVKVRLIHLGVLAQIVKKVSHLLGDLGLCLGGKHHIAV